MSDTPRRSGKVNAHAYALLIAGLSDGPVTRHDLAAKTGLFEQTISHYVNELRRVKPKQVFIHSWEYMDVRHQTPLYMLGGEPDAPRGKPMSSQEISRRYSQAKKMRVASVFELRGVL